MCGLPFLCHVKPPTKKARNKPQRYRPSSKNGETIYLGMDGEGQGRKYHKYIFLACSNEDGSFKRSVENFDGLSTTQAFDFLLDLNIPYAKIFTYSFGYDLTKILTDVDNENLYKLFHPEVRARTGKEALKGPYPIHWRGYKLNYQGSKFTLINGKTRIVIWDIFKFFQSKFVGAIKDWKVGNDELWDRMQSMKDQRDQFDKLSFQQVKDYCFEECMCMAQLAHKLTDAHTKAGLKLTNYYGAGSSAAAMLKVMKIQDVIESNHPKEMNEAISRAFFGGRFENSVIGAIDDKLYSYDISSAYPYQLYFLPCLQHGKWRYTRIRSDIDQHDISLVHYGLLKTSLNKAWGPFPYRTEDGCICFPIQSGGGWVYGKEYKAGERLFSNVRFREAWIYEKRCDCVPFQRIPTYYLERIKLGKEGPGIVIKLGCNSCYGKLAQSVGKAMFNSWLWAGMITSGTRAQLLEMLALHKDISNCLMMATDGIVTRERICTPVPLETGTFTVNKPLGGWEEKIVSKGMFFARPGIYFPLAPTKNEIKDIRGRGVGKGVVLENWQRIMNAWPCDVADTIAVTNISRFCGAKSSISVSGPIGAKRYKRAAGTGSEPCYGQWISRKVEMSFTPRPKRERVADDGRSLIVRRMPMNIESSIYDRCVFSEERKELVGAEVEVWEQPDGDLTEYE